MARSLSIIIAQMDAEQALKPELSALNSPSTTAIYTLWKYIVAMNSYLQEVLWDIFKKELENVVLTAAVGSEQWLQSKIFTFQYSSATPQITTLINFAPTYLTINPSLRIITRASVKTTATNTVSVKVAKSEPPVALTSTEKNSLKGYLSQGGNGSLAGAGVGIGSAGIYVNVESYDADKLFLTAQIIYNGQYSSVIQTTVIDAINLYLKNIPFDGMIKVVSVVDAIQSVPGVTDVIINDMAVRADLTPFASKIYLVSGNLEIMSKYPTYAGYIIGENTALNTFMDTLTFIPE
jgi:hypothetical protein